MSRFIFWRILEEMSHQYYIHSDIADTVYSKKNQKNFKNIPLLETLLKSNLFEYLELVTNAKKSD